MAPKACTVVVHDLNDTAHQLDVTAETLYEAVAQALAIARGHDWVGDIGRGMTTVTVKVRNPEITHIVKIQDVENWLNRGCKSQADMVLKNEAASDVGDGQTIIRTVRACPASRRSGSTRPRGTHRALRLGHSVTIPHAEKKGSVAMAAMATISSSITSTMTTSMMTGMLTATMITTTITTTITMATAITTTTAASAADAIN